MQDNKAEIKIPVGLESAPFIFDVCGRVKGKNGSNLQYITNQTGAEVALIGRGSGYPELGRGGQESLEPMSIQIRHYDSEVVQKACQLATGLLLSVRQAYKEFFSRLQQSLPTAGIDPSTMALPTKGISTLSPGRLFPTKSVQKTSETDQMPHILQQLQQAIQSQTTQHSQSNKTEDIDKLVGVLKQLEQTVQPQLLPQSSKTQLQQLYQTLQQQQPLQQSQSNSPINLNDLVTIAQKQQVQSQANQFTIDALSEEFLLNRKILKNKLSINERKEEIKILAALARGETLIPKDNKRKKLLQPPDKVGLSGFEQQTKEINDLAQIIPQHNIKSQSEQIDQALQHTHHPQFVKARQPNKVQEINQLSQIVQTLQQTVESEKLALQANSVKEKGKLEEVVQQLQQIIHPQTAQRFEPTNKQKLNHPKEQLHEVGQIAPQSRSSNKVDQLTPSMEQLKQNIIPYSSETVTPQLSNENIECQQLYQLLQRSSSNEVEELTEIMKQLHRILETKLNLSTTELELMIAVTEQLNQALAIQCNISSTELENLLENKNLSNITNEVSLAELEHLMKGMFKLKTVLSLEPTMSSLDLQELDQILQTLTEMSQTLSYIPKTKLDKFNNVIMDLFKMLKHKKTTDKSEIKPFSIVKLEHKISSESQKQNVDLRKFKSETETCILQERRGDPLKCSAEAVCSGISTAESRDIKEASLLNPTPLAKPSTSSLAQCVEKPDLKVQDTCKFQSPDNMTIKRKSEDIQSDIQRLKKKLKTYSENVQENTVLKQKYLPQKQEIDDTLTTTRISYDGKCLQITLVPPKVDSLFASLGHLLLGPFYSISKLSAAAISLQERSINYIRENKTMFYDTITRLYDKVFPCHKLDRDSAFESCCDYINKPGHMGAHELMVAVSTMFKTPIKVFYEESIKFAMIDPISQGGVKASISILCRKGNANFDPIDKIDVACNSNSISSSLIVPSKNVTKKCAVEEKTCMMVATWMTHGNYSKKFRNKIDSRLTAHKIDLAFLQGIPSRVREECIKTEIGETYSTNYIWYTTATREHKGSATVCFLANKHSKVVLSDFNFKSCYVASAKVLFRDTEFFVIGCHLTENKAKYNFSMACLERYLNIPNKSQLLLLGNFNAEVGRNNITNAEKNLIGPNLFHLHSNLNGMVLKKLAVRYDLRFISTFSKKEMSGDNKAMATGKKGNNHVQCSYILLQQQPIRETDTFSWWEEQTKSEHAIVACSINVDS